MEPRGEGKGKRKTDPQKRRKKEGEKNTWKGELGG